jgi:hypothetical protein
MDYQEAQREFQKILEGYDMIESPRYRNAVLEDLKQKYDRLTTLKDHLTEDPGYYKLVNSMSQTIAKMRALTQERQWSNLSERSINKAFQPHIKKGDRGTDFPLEWKAKTGQTCFICNGYWGPRNYMVMDVLGYMFLLKEGGDRLPENTNPVFEDLDSVRARESQFETTSTAGQLKAQTSLEPLHSRILNEKYYVRFKDSDFRKFTALRMSSNDILKLLQETSRVQFKLVFPVRLTEKGKPPGEKNHVMNVFSHPFELAYTDTEVREDGIVQGREYHVIFNTILGELFVHNLKTKNYDWLDTSFYNLPGSAQIFYRRFLIHNDFPQFPINLETIAEKLDLQDKNITNLTATIERNTLEPLKTYGLISSYQREEGLQGVKYIIQRPLRKQE